MEKLPKRKRNRLEEFDYSHNGTYFVTICTENMNCVLSQIVGATSGRPPKVRLTEIGRAAANELKRINEIYENVVVDNFVIMPNHIHLLITIDDCGLGRPKVAPTEGSATHGRPKVAPTVSRIMQQFKGTVTKQVGCTIWQKGFYDHVIRDEEDFLLHMQYIDENPKKWLMGKDEYYS